MLLQNCNLRTCSTDSMRWDMLKFNEVLEAFEEFITDLENDAPVLPPKRKGKPPVRPKRRSAA